MSKAFYVWTASMNFLHHAHVPHHFFDWSPQNTIKKHCLLPAEKDVNVSMKASGTWSHDSKALIVETFVRVVEVGGGVKVGCIGMRAAAAAAARHKRVPDAVVGCRVMVVRMRHSQQNRRSLERHSNQFFECIQFCTFSQFSFSLKP